MILQFLNNWQSVLYISLGAVLGANLRVLIINNSPNLISKYWVTSLVNIISSFLLGYFLAWYPRFQYINDYQQYYLCFSVGFVGALSTFSTFIIEAFQLLINQKY